MSPADKRDKPFFVEDSCPECGAGLELVDHRDARFLGTEAKEDDIWYDEWVCVAGCEGVIMDWPQSDLLAFLESLENLGDTSGVPWDDDEEWLNEVQTKVSHPTRFRGDC